MTAAEIILNEELNDDDDSNLDLRSAVTESSWVGLYFPPPRPESLITRQSITEDMLHLVGIPGTDVVANVD